MSFENIPVNVVDKLFSEISIFVIAFDQKGTALFCNNMAERAYGKQLVGLSFDQIFPQEQRGRDDKDSKLRYECWVAGRHYIVTDLFDNYIHNSETISARYIIGYDITDMKNNILTQSSQSRIDPMTGIFNKQVGIDYLKEMIEQVRSENYHYFSVIYLDLDNLKYINDNFGHNKGDDYILSICNTIKTSTRRSDIFSRMGGDEFLLIFPYCGINDATKIMENIVGKINNTNKTLPPGIMYRISYGIQEVNYCSTLDFKQILNYVDSKMYIMKSANRVMDKQPDEDVADTTDRS